MFKVIIAGLLVRFVLQIIHHLVITCALKHSFNILNIFNLLQNKIKKTKNSILWLGMLYHQRKPPPLLPGPLLKKTAIKQEISFFDNHDP